MAESLKFIHFLEALRALCAEHQVILAVSNYDALQVWDARAGEGPLEFNGIQDRTGLNLAPHDEEEA